METRSVCVDKGEEFGSQDEEAQVAGAHRRISGRSWLEAIVYVARLNARWRPRETECRAASELAANRWT